MKDLTDLEICKRIAEIEGAKETLYSYSNFNKPKELTAIFESSTHFDYNPLTDNYLCFSLMLRHEVSLTYGEYAVNAEILIEKEDGEHSFSAQAYCPSRAICLAIIMSKV
jgi:hypothetical protein